MAFSGVTARLFSGERSADASIAGSPDAAIVTNRWVCVIAAMDNVSTTTQDTTEYSASDTDGHTWTPLWERTYSPTGAAADAFTIGAFLAETSAEIGTGDTITVTTSNGTPLAKVLAVFEFQAANPVVMEGSAAYDVADAGATLSGLTNVEHLFVGVCIRENESTGVTEDADYTGIGDALSGTAGATTTNLALHVGHRILTGTGDTYLPSGAGSGDRMQVLFALTEDAGGGGTNYDEPLAFTIVSSQVLTDQLEMNEALTDTYVTSQTMSDRADFNDSLGFTFVWVDLLTDSMGGGTNYDEPLAFTIVSSQTLADQLAMTEPLADTWVSVQTLIDQLAMSEAFADTWVSVQTLIDQLTRHESLSTTITSLQTLADQADFNDSLGFTFTWVDVLVDSVPVVADPFERPYLVAIFYRNDGALVMSYGADRSMNRGFRISEGMEQASDRVRVPESHRIDGLVDDAINAAWIANQGAGIATLRAAINEALNDAGYRAPDGSLLPT